MVPNKSNQRTNGRPPSKHHSLTVIFMTLAAVISLTMSNLSHFMLTHTTTNIKANTIGNADYSLAKEQSFGFFTDIRDENWKIAQRYHSSLFPNYYADPQIYSNGNNDKGKTKQLRNSHMWYGQVSGIQYGS